MNFLDALWPTAKRNLPSLKWGSDAYCLLYAIALQESGGKNIAQHPHGPARGYWQEEAALRYLFMNPATAPLALHAMAAAGLPAPAHGADGRMDAKHATTVFATLQDQLLSYPVLQLSFARLILFAEPSALPSPESGPDAGWNYYIRTWRPGAPRRGTWNEYWALAQEATKVHALSETQASR